MPVLAIVPCQHKARKSEKDSISGIKTVSAEASKRTNAETVREREESPVCKGKCHGHLPKRELLTGRVEASGNQKMAPQ